MMLSTTLPVAEADARKQGWTTVPGTLAELRRSAAYLGWEELPTRAGDPVVSELRPAEATEASPRSLSAVYGLGAQPLHTDGAHLPKPPDLIVLQVDEPNETPTLLWTEAPGRVDQSHRLPWDDSAHGVFLVNLGRDSFFTSAKLGLGYRYDPGCMTPCDQRARAVTKFFTDAADRVHQHHWSNAEEMLVIDNRNTLHARATVLDTDRARLLRRVAFRTRPT